MERLMKGLEEQLREMGKIVDDALANYLSAKKPKYLYEASRHLPLAGGKRFRPIMAMLSCEAVGGNRLSALPFGIALELIHTFTLIHDDIIDEDDERRGIPSVHARFGESTAIIAGDLLFAKAFDALADLEVEPRILNKIMKELAEMTIQICEGQQMDLSFEGMDTLPEREWIEMIEKKTARLFEGSAMGGAMIGNGSDDEIKALNNYGRNFGIAFQLWDDCLDLIGGEKLGKPIGSDIKKGKRTLMVLHLFATGNERDKREFKSILGDVEAEDGKIGEAIDILNSNGSIDYVRNRALLFSSNAKKSIEKIADSTAKDFLIQLADYAVERDK
jgi:geranylgeranyl diphosphate synthase type I